MRVRRYEVAFLMLVAGGSLTGVSGAQAATRSYVVSLFVPAMNNSDDSDCPDGKNPIAPEILARVLKEEGRPQAEIERLLAPGTFGNGVFSQNATMRGRVDGKPVNVYHNPLSVPDPDIKLAITKEAFGFNLDGRERPDDPVDPLTREKGVDNQAARVFGCFDRTRGTLDGPPVNWSVRWNYYSWGNSWLVEIRTKGDAPINVQREDDVEVHFYRGLQPPIKNSAGYQRDMTYDIDPDPRVQGNVFKGKIRDGMFISDSPAAFKMIASTRLNPVFDFKQARLRLAFKPDGTLEGFLAGYLPVNMVYFPFGNYAAAAEFNGGMDIPGVYHALRRLADTDIDLDPETGARTRISQTYLLRAAPAFLTRPAAGGRTPERRQQIALP